MPNLSSFKNQSQEDGCGAVAAADAEAASNVVDDDVDVVADVGMPVLSDAIFC